MVLSCVELDFPTNKMQRRTGKFGARLPPSDMSSREDFMKASTYLAKIAVVLQDAPDKMLTFTELMGKMVPLISEDRKSVDNNIRVCLSTHRCFIKIPVVKDSLNSKKNYWKLDCGQISEKMVRRHFKEIIHLFPELASKVATEGRRGPSEQSSTPHPEPSACKAQVRPEVKFSSPFSIESLLKRDSPSAGGCRASPLSSVQVRAQQQSQTEHTPAGTKRSFSWDPDESLFHSSVGISPFYPAGVSTNPAGVSTNPAGVSTNFRPVTTRVAQLTTRIIVPSEPSFPVYTRASAALYFTSPHRSYITYSGPAFPREALRF